MQVNNIQSGYIQQSGQAGNLRFESLSDSGACLSEELRAAFQAIPAGIVFINRLGVVELANKGARKLFQKDIHAMPWREVIRHYFVPQKDDGLEVSLVSGRKVKFSISKIPGIPGQLIHLTDLTETRALQTKVSHMHRLSSLGKMMASLAHQLRTPLSAALLYARNLQSTGLACTRQTRFSEKLITRLKDLEKQINDMLLFAKSGAENIIEKVDLITLCQQLSCDTLEEKTDLQLKINCHSANGNYVILGNSTAISGALNNLLQNAQSVGATSIDIGLSQDDSWLALSVCDNGPGIPVKDREKLFEPFFTTRTQGTGLGLAVVRAVMTSHKGQVTAKNNDAGGATFTLRFPVALLSNKANEHGLKQSDQSELSETTGSVNMAGEFA
ncbi:sensor histidine kinase [Planctobacterium marinum]|uniref:sensor histidine kinase n=1 Tax=Planctobacterium marinum TaxID=1631968 RepID=UPI001E2D231C|nr:PAS domain-containing sensor histidine kinase [Planctobacterium marinum]